MKNKILMLCGILAPVVYVLTVILGGILRPEYSHLSQTVSDLIATEAPNKSLLDTLFGVYNLLTLAFGVGLFQYIHANNQDRGKVVGTLGALFLVADSLFGLITLFFPEPVGGMSAPITSTGAMHIVFAGLSSLTTMLAILFIGFWFRNSQLLRVFALYSFVSVAVVFLSGGIAAIRVANQSPIAGLLERITIGGFLLWLLVIGWRLYFSDVPNMSASNLAGVKVR